MAARGRHVVVVLALALVLGGCGGDDGRETAAATSTTTTTRDDLTRFCHDFGNLAARLGETLNLNSPAAAAEWAKGVARTAQEMVAGAPAQVRSTLATLSGAADELANYLGGLPPLQAPDRERLRQLNSKVFTTLQELATAVQQSCAGVEPPPEPPPGPGG